MRVGARAFRTACEKYSLPLPNIIIYSPWERTAQTAQLIATEFPSAELAAEDVLAPFAGDSHSVNQFLERCEQVDSNEHLVLVSHQPSVSAWVNFYLGPGHPVPGLSPGALAVLSFDRVGSQLGRLRFWAAPPDYTVEAQ